MTTGGTSMLTWVKNRIVAFAECPVRQSGIAGEDVDPPQQHRNVLLVAEDRVTQLMIRRLVIMMERVQSQRWKDKIEGIHATLPGKHAQVHRTSERSRLLGSMSP